MQFPQRAIFHPGRTFYMQNTREKLQMRKVLNGDLIVDLKPGTMNDVAVSPDGQLVIDIMTRLGTRVSYQDLSWEEVQIEDVTVRVATAAACCTFCGPRP